MLLSTHIVDDIAQTSRQVAILAAGRLIYHDSTDKLIDAARGHVWTLTTQNPSPTDSLTVVSALQVAGGVSYRLISLDKPARDAEATEPTLEDGYVALMRTNIPPRARPVPSAP